MIFSFPIKEVATTSAFLLIFATTRAGTADDLIKNGETCDLKLQAADALSFYLPAERLEPNNAHLLPLGRCTRGSIRPCLPGSEFLLDLDMVIPTEPIGSIPRPQKLIEAFARYDRGSISQEEFASICNEAVRDTIEKFEATGSPVITDGEQTKPSFATYPIHTLSN